MKQNSELRADARQALQGNWKTMAIMTAIYAAVFGAISYALKWYTLNDLTYVASLLTLPIGFAFATACLSLLRGEVKGYGHLFSEYNGRVYLTGLLIMLYTFLWALLLIIPGIIKQYSYSMTYFIMEDDKTISKNAAIKKSMNMMDGYKMDLFLLDLSFIGWYLLTIITCGIGLLWVLPYHETARAAFYESLKENIIVE